MDHRSKWKNIKPLEKHIRKDLPDPRLGKTFLCGTRSMTYKIKNKDKLNFIDIKNFSSASDAVKRM